VNLSAFARAKAFELPEKPSENPVHPVNPVPKSIIQTSPTLTTGIVFLHAVEQGRTLCRRLIAECNILVVRREFEQPLAN
jgi:hypothetical protein